jgi:dihydroorotate dehydrogenase
MGFNNDGVVAVASRLKTWREKQHINVSGNHRLKNISAAVPGTSLPVIIGGNIGKNKLTPNEDAWKDYETCFKALYDYVDYFVVNVSSPTHPA